MEQSSNLAVNIPLDCQIGVIAMKQRSYVGSVSNRDDSVEVVRV